MTEPAADPIKSVQWFPAPSGARSKGGLGSALVKLSVGAAVGLLLFIAHRVTAATVVWAITGTIGLISLASAVARRAIDGGLAWLGRAIASVLGTVLLTLVYVLVITPTHYVRRLLGADDLNLRDTARRSYWLPCDDEKRKVRYVGSMFATEVRTGGGHPVRTAALVLAVLAVLAEGILRTQGFGSPVLYVADPDIGFYPQPSTKFVRYGGRIITNRFGMRSAEIDREKPPGTFRIFMIGDSTLYGGSYVDQDDIYSSRIQKSFDVAQGLPGRVEVLAMGCNAWGPFHERGFIRKYPDAFQADLAIVQMPINDVDRPLSGLMDVPYFAVGSPPRLALEEVANHLMWRYRAGNDGVDDAWKQRQAETGIREYAGLVGDLQRAGAEVMIFVLPSRAPGFGGEEPPKDARWRAELTSTVADLGVHTYFAQGLFAGKGTPDEIYHDNVHLNPRGHKAYAEFLEETITRNSVRYGQWSSGTRSGLGKPDLAPSKP